MNALRLSWKNIKHRPWRSGLAVLLMASGLSIVIILILTQGQIDEKFEKNLSDIDLVVGAKGSPLQLVLSSVYHIDNPTGNIKEKQTTLLKKHPFIEKSIPICLGDNYKSYRIVGTTHQYLELYNAKVKDGKLWEKPMEIVVGANVFEKFPGKLTVGSCVAGGHGIGGEALEEHNHSHDDAPYKVVGVLEPTGTVIDNLLICEYTSSWIVHAGHGGGASLNLKMELDPPVLDSVKVDSSNLDSIIPEKIIEEVVAEDNHDDHGHDHAHHHHHHVECGTLNTDSILATIPEDQKEITAVLVKYKNQRGQLTIPNMINSNSSMMAANPSIERDRMLKLVDSGIQTANLMGYFVLIISAISVFIALYSSLKDRGYEIALTRVLGASKAKVLLMILAEGLILAISGFILALIISHVGMWIVSGILESNYHYSFDAWSFSGWELILFAVSLGIGLISALIPAIKAYRTDISTALSK
ncbi:MAG: putative ABC transport system permease protein [Parvicellaceae bacterium]|jgi:putative ABC transport system permease protein